jgi:flagellar biogenesis protein FliO
MSLADTLNTLLFSSFMKYHSMVYQFYQLHHNLADTGSNWVHYTFSMLAQQLLWQLFGYFLIAMIGLFAANLFYRMSKPMKIAVFIGVPVLCFFILPLLDENLWDYHLARGLGKTVNLLWGFSNDYNVFTGALSMLVLAAACGVLIWLLMRRMNLKNAKEAV